MHHPKTPKGVAASPGLDWRRPGHGSSSKAYAPPAPREMSVTDSESVLGLSRSSSHHRATYESSPSHSSHSHTHSSSSQLSSSASSSRRNGGVLDVRINADPPSSSTSAGGSAHTTDTTILSAGRGKKRPTERQADEDAFLEETGGRGHAEMQAEIAKLETKLDHSMRRFLSLFWTPLPPGMSGLVGRFWLGWKFCLPFFYSKKAKKRHFYPRNG